VKNKRENDRENADGRIVNKGKQAPRAVIRVFW
jgi:hypothetical protein